ncbi:hypothetical protein IWQ56_007412 [Coemansia nantahalensis]|nr:hypothetical protein IWQ56_007412 [Coemansia nantahalensis]
MAYSSGGAAHGDIPKVQLESKDDVHFLQQQFSEFLEQTVASNSTLRGAGLSEEQRREAQQLVLERMQRWTRDMWAVAGHSISVNGLAFDEAMAEKSNIEPLDEALKGEVEALREEADSLLLSVSGRRRTVPGQIERLVADAVARESLAAASTAAIRGLDDPPHADLPFIDGRVNAEFESALGLAAKLAAEAPATADRLRRLDDTLHDTRARGAAEAEDDGKVRSILLPAAAAAARGAAASGLDAQLLAYRAALHAVSSD